MSFSTVQHDGRVIRAVRQLPGGYGRNVFAGGGAGNSCATFTTLPSQFQLEQSDYWLPDRQRYNGRRGYGAGVTY